MAFKLQSILIWAVANMENISCGAFEDQTTQPRVLDKMPERFSSSFPLIGLAIRLGRRVGAAGLIGLAVAGAGATARAAPAMRVLHSFSFGTGSEPVGNLISDGAGDLYGATARGGPNGRGVVFELKPPTPSRKFWTEKVLHAFDGLNGDAPVGDLLADGAGNLFGTTFGGGPSYGNGLPGDGVVFELSPPAAGRTAWHSKILYAFHGTDGNQPAAGLIADAAGNLYGTTQNGGANGLGVVFELSPPVAGNSTWTEQVLYSFSGLDGIFPFAGLLSDKAGNLYGTTLGGGENYQGNVFELSPPPEGNSGWTEKTLFSFDGTDGWQPYGGLIADAAGNLYGVTNLGGPYPHDSWQSRGLAYEISPPAPGQSTWTETVLMVFHKLNGRRPRGPLLADGAGNLYGVTQFGGRTYGQGSQGDGGEANRKGFPGDGEVYKLSPPAAGQTAWTEKLLVSFDGANGADPVGGLFADGAGNLYGTAGFGGKYDTGVVFKVTP